MMVTFVSQCEKTALKKTRRVLDAFANRIGNRTWQTVITSEGLQAVKKLLRKTASKNTAVSCHWIRSRSRSELLWVVGKRSKFAHDGTIPVNITQKTIMNTQLEDDWQYLPLIKSLTALAALLHDWGKSSEYFQWKLMQKGRIGDPYRHEWISLLFLSAYCMDSTDEEWLSRMEQGDFDLKGLKARLQTNKRPFKNLPDAGLLLGWLVVTHHRLPVKDSNTGRHHTDWRKFLRLIRVSWQYQNNFIDDFDKQLERCFAYPKGLPTDSSAWLREVKKQAIKVKKSLPLLKKAISDGSWRSILLYARLSLMLGDHFYSSLEPSSKLRVKSRDLKELFANTDKHNKPKQTLDEHLLGVAKHAQHNAHFLPYFEGRAFNGEVIFQSAQDVPRLKRKSQDINFRWQDTAVSKIKQWLGQQDKKLDKRHFGFFAVNMASTGKGKTFANAKIMQALSSDGNSLRYVLALGLRTLTLQTGDEYRDRIGLDESELAVLIGSKAVQQLHNHNIEVAEDDEDVFGGSASQEPLLDNELDFSAIPHIENLLEPVLRRPKDRQFLYAPVLACTIDHIIGATETKRGGRYILPTLRLMYSDLVIDEIDDFDNTDLIAIGRLIHLAGMLGRKVMISSATIPPDMAEGYYNAYQEGWKIFAKMRNRNPEVGCAWIDEFKTQVQSIKPGGVENYREFHQKYISKRQQKLKQETIKRKAEIIPIMPTEGSEEETEKKLYQAIQQSVIALHQRHAIKDQQTGKQVSFGVVRVANIAPCIDLSRFLLTADWGNDTEIRTMAYHSQQILVMRHAQEQHLDEVLKRKQGKQASLEHPLIRSHINSIEAQNVIFILVATPVEEVGRDHDFDWAVVEPSSYRSIIQLAGRILRHQNLAEDIDSANMGLLQFNRKGLLGRSPAFQYPGYESSELQLEIHDLTELVDQSLLAKRVDASLRIQRRNPLHPTRNLADLEHEVIHRLLSNYEAQGASTLQDWLTGFWWLSGVPQEKIRFRRSSPQQTLFLLPENRGWKFCEKQRDGSWIPVEKQLGISHENELTEIEKERLWLQRDYPDWLKQAGKNSLEQTAKIYGEINVTLYANETQPNFIYNPQLGMLRKRKGENNA